jgi:DHA1 family multidrug resistance protein-like MFS transporter
MNRLVFSILATTMLLSMIGFGLIMPLLPIYARDFGATNVEVGLLFSVTSIANVVTLPLAGPLSDRYGRVIFLCIGLTLLAVAALGFIWSESVLQLLLFRTLQGVAFSMHLPVAQAMLGDMTPPGEEGRWMGYFSAIMFAGLGTGPLVGGVVSDAYSPEVAFGLCALSMFASLVVTVLFLREPKRHHEHAGGRTPRSDLLRNRVVLAVLVMQFCNGILFGLSMAFIPVLASEALALSASAIGLILFIRTPVSTLQSWSGRFADTHNRKVQIVAGAALATVAIALMPDTTGLWTLLIANAGLSLGVVLSQPATSAYVVEQGRSVGMGFAMSLFLMAMQLGAGLGPIAAGSVMNRGGLALGFHTAALINLAGIATFLLLMRGVPGKRQRGVSATAAGSG